MSYEFFFSYTRANNDEFLRRFFADLSEAVRLKKGLPQDDTVGFFDQQDLELGQEWDPTLASALQNSRVLVCLYSPAYFKSEYCGKEWQVFGLRSNSYMANEHARRGVNIEAPPVIKPVVWIPLRPEMKLPSAVAKAQYTRGDPKAVENVLGLRYMRKQYQKYETEYNDFVEKLSDEILDTASKYPLPSLPALPSLKNVQSAFSPTEIPGEGPSPKPATSGPKFVQFVYVAGHPGHFPQGVRSQLDCYLQEGGRDWKPYYPERPRPIRAVVENVASGEDLDFYSEELPFSNSLADDVRRAEEERKIVVLLVDSWTAGLSSYKQVLQTFDRQNYLNCSVLVPWNDSDLETTQKRALLEQTLQETFYFRASPNLKNPLHFRDSIHSEEDLRKQLREVLTRLKDEIINKAEISRPLPSGGEKPIISGPGGGSRS
jgi:FxsC-like protein